MTTETGSSTDSVFRILVAVSIGFRIVQIRCLATSTTSARPAAMGATDTLHTRSSVNRVSSPIHQMLNGPSFGHGRDGMIRHDRLDTRTSLTFLFVRHRTSPWHRLALLVSHVDDIGVGLFHFNVVHLVDVGLSKRVTAVVGNEREWVRQDRKDDDCCNRWRERRQLRGQLDQDNRSCVRYRNCSKKCNVNGCWSSKKKGHRQIVTHPRLPTNLGVSF